MVASYPGTRRAFASHVNSVEVVDASHMNEVQDEIVAIQATVGVNPQISSGSTGSSLGAWSASSRTYTSLADRLANIEAGHLADTHGGIYAKLGGTEVFTGTKSFTAETSFGAATGTTSGSIVLSSGTTGGQATVAFREGTTARWLEQLQQGSTTLRLRDMTNARDHVTYAPGATSAAAVTSFFSTVSVAGNATVTGTFGVTGATTLTTLTLSGALSLAAGTGVTPSTSAVGDAGAGGTSTTPARADHVHGREAFGTSATAAAVAGTSGPGTATTTSRADHVHAVAVGNVVAHTSFGIASTNGTATTVARADHSHGTPPAPTASSVGALPITGGILTGEVNVTYADAVLMLNNAGNNTDRLRLVSTTGLQLAQVDDELRVVAVGTSGTYRPLRAGDIYGTAVYDSGNRVYSSANPPPSAAPVVIMPFFVGGSVSIGLKRPEFLATVPMRLRGARSRCQAGSGTYEIYVNGVGISGTLAASTTQAFNDFTDYDINAGDIVKLNVASSTSMEDLSVTVDVVTR